MVVQKHRLEKAGRPARGEARSEMPVWQQIAMNWLFGSSAFVIGIPSLSVNVCPPHTAVPTCLPTTVLHGDTPSIIEVAIVHAHHSDPKVPSGSQEL